MTSTSTARVRCACPKRYAKQLVSRLSGQSDARFDDDEGRGYLSFSGEDSLRGEVDLIAGDGILLLQLEAEPASIDGVESTVGSWLVELGRGGDLEVAWKRMGADGGTCWRSADLSG